MDLRQETFLLLEARLPAHLVWLAESAAVTLPPELLAVEAHPGYLL
jgi:hypothetical protein